MSQIKGDTKWFIKRHEENLKKQSKNKDKDLEKLE